MELEEKTFPFEIKELTEEGTFEGYAAIFGIPDALNETIEKGAFTRSLNAQKQFPLLWYHDPRDPIGMAEVSKDDKGLKVKGMLNLKVQSALEKYYLMKQKAIKGLSFGFKTLKDLWTADGRILKEVRLFEISPVTFQMHPLATVESVKQFDEEKPYPLEHSARLKSPGLFDSETFRRKSGGTLYGSKKVPATIAIIWGKLKTNNKPSDMPIPQSLRFPTKSWTVETAKKWLKDNGIKFETFEPAAKSLEGVLGYLDEYKSGRVISAANLKLLSDASKALAALLKASDPLKSTQFGEKSILTPIIEVLGEAKALSNPQEHLFRSVIKALENQNKE